jgi:selT/selW/selH-like putative selenoprotein
VLAELGPSIKEWSLIPGDGGRFEVTVNGKLVFSKLQSQRHVGVEELSGLIRREIEAL